MKATISPELTPVEPGPGAGPGRGEAALAGVIGVGAALAVAELLAALGTWTGLLRTAASPLTSLANSFIELTPEWLKRWAISAFGVHDKDALKTGMGLVLVLLAATIGLLWRRSRRLALVVFALLAAVACVAVLTRTGAQVWDLIPTLAGAACGVMALSSAFRPDRLTGDAGVDRRRFLRLIGGTAVGAAAAGVLARLIPSAAKVEASREAVKLPALPTAPPATSGTSTAVPRAAAQVIPADADLNLNGLAPYVTQNGAFYRIDTAIVPPLLRAEDWKLRVHGMVQRELHLDFATLQARPQQERAVTLTCVSNEVGGDLISNARWTGARLDALLAEAGPSADADCVLSTSVDGFTVTTPLAVLTDGRDAMLAIGMNGQPLPIEHGFPVRMVVPGLYGYVSATKWVVDLELTRFDKVTAYWTDRGWAPQGPIKTSSRIDVPRSPAQFAQGHRVTFGGVAWAQHRGINEVQLQIDDGPWLRAELAGTASVDTWRQWKLDWTATGVGTHRVRCRAVDGTGAKQVAAVAPPAPDGATGYHEIQVKVTAR